MQLVAIDHSGTGVKLHQSQMLSCWLQCDKDHAILALRWLACWKSQYWRWGDCHWDPLFLPSPRELREAAVRKVGHGVPVMVCEIEELLFLFIVWFRPSSDWINFCWIHFDASFKDNDSFPGTPHNPAPIHIFRAWGRDHYPITTLQVIRSRKGHSSSFEMYW